jgi:hypothetical protein
METGSDFFGMPGEKPDFHRIWHNYFYNNLVKFNPYAKEIRLNEQGINYPVIFTAFCSFQLSEGENR